MFDKLLVLGAAGALAFSTLTATPDAAPGPRPLEGQTFAIDPGHSSAVFRVMHLGTSPFWGRFNEVTGEIAIDADDLKNSSVKVEIPVGSIDTNNEQRDGHLKSAEFFSAREFPTLTFVSTKIVRKKDDLFHITGDLTLRGKTKEVTVPAQYFGTNEINERFGTRTGWEAQFELDRTDFGINYGAENNVLGTTVEVTLALEGVLKDS